MTMMMCDPCSGHSTRDRDIVDGCNYSGHMIDDCGHDGHGHVGAPDDGPLMEIAYGDGPLMTLMECWMMLMEPMMR